MDPSGDKRFWSLKRILRQFIPTRRTIHWRVSIVLLLLLVMLGAFLAFFFGTAGSEATLEAIQVVNWEVASSLAEKLQPYLGETVDYGKIDDLIINYRETNPSVDVYLLKKDGSIDTYFYYAEDLHRKKVDLGPIYEFLKNDPYAHLPIYGDDPRQDKDTNLISVARVTLGHSQGYLYVVLGAQNNSTLPKLVLRSYAARSSLIVVLLAVLLSAILGFFLFFIITRRLYRFIEAIKELQKGDYSKRIPVTARDEVGLLAITYNEMAETITSQIQKLEQTDSLRRELVSSVSHDLRGPLTSVQGYLEELLGYGEDLNSAESRRELEIVYRNVQSLIRQVGDLFELSKLEARDITPVVRQFDVHQMALDVLAKYRPIAEKHRITLELKDEGKPALVEGDISLLERAISNLVDNAIRYTPEGGTVRVILEPSNGMGLLVKVSDTGVGIPPEDLPKIFDRFYRVNKGRSKEVGGTGLGLAIVKKIIEAHNCTINVRSLPNEGTTFEFSLPRERDA